MSNQKKLITVIGATGNQGGGVMRALQARADEFRVRALMRPPATQRGIADEVVEADLNRPETLKAAFKGAYGVFAVTNSWEPGTDEIAQATAAIRAAHDVGVQHFVWSTLPNVKVISGGKYDVPHFTNKALVDELVRSAGFRHHTFVVPPFFYQNLLKGVAPQRQEDGSMAWTLPLDPGARVIHAGDITELGDIVAGAFANPLEAGNVEYLPLVGDLLSFSDMIQTLNLQGHHYKFNKVPRNVFATFFPGAAELAEMFGYFEDYTYLGGNWDDQIARARRIAGKPPKDFATWARVNMPAKQSEIAGQRT